MRYSQQRTESNNNLFYIATIAKAAGIVGLAYLAYQKRTQISDGISKAKDATGKIIEPIVDGVKKSSNELTDLVKAKSEDAAQAVITISTQLEDKYHQLEGDAKQAYSDQLISLRDKLDTLIDKADNKTSVNTQSTNQSSATNTNNITKLNDGKNETKPSNDLKTHNSNSGFGNTTH